jgi:hypothetical protein
MGYTGRTAPALAGRAMAVARSAIVCSGMASWLHG